MKKQTLLLVVAIMSICSLVKAQGGFQRRTVEERVKIIHQKFDSTFKLDDAKQALVDSVFTHYYQAQDKTREEMMAGGGQVDREAMRSQMQELATSRDNELKAILTESQMKTWKDELEPSLRPRRGDGMRATQKQAKE